MRKLAPVLLMAVTTISSHAQAPGDRPAPNPRATRSVVMARNGIIATSQPLASAAGLAVLLAQGITDFVLKPLVQRPRPFVTVADARVVGTRPVTLSFPSGHASISVAAAASWRSRWRS